MLHKLLAITLLFLATGCASVGAPSSPSQLFGDISKLTTADIEAALTDAIAHGDQPAMQCYPVLLQLVQSLPSSAPSAPKGVVSAFQAARDLGKAAQSQAAGGKGTVVQAFNLGCAALVNDAQGDALRLGAIIRP